MPPKRRGAQAKSASAPKAEQPKPVSKPPPPPPPPPESDANRVRKEWSKFMETWYEPQKKKLVEKLQKDLLVKYKNLGSAKDTQKLREMELFEKLDALAQQLAQPARAEWERRLELAQLREDQWDDMSGEEQQEVMSVFVGFVDELDDDSFSADPSFDDDESEEQQLHRPPGPSKPSIPPTPIKANFEFVKPTSLFTDTVTPPHPSKNLPSLSMDHLATLGPSNAGRSAEPASASLGGFQSWASEAGIVNQAPSPKPPVPATLAQPASARLRAPDMSRQPSAASSLSSPPLNASPQYSPPKPISPPINPDNLPLGKRYIGPIILEEDPDPLDEGLLKSKMAEEYQQYKISLRIQMIYQFHAEAAEVEIKLFETLLADHGTKESRARAVQDHETSMMRLREQKEEDRKRLCAEEREKRLQEIQQTLAQRRREEPVSKASRPTKAAHQKENVPLSQPPPPPPPVVPSAKLEPPSVVQKSISTLSQDEASANEAIFANAMAALQKKGGAPGLTPAQALSNEAVFSNAAAAIAMLGTKNDALQPTNVVKKSNGIHDVPQITVSFAEPPPSVEPAQVPPAAQVKGKKGKKGPVVKPVAITEESEMEMDAEPPPPAPVPSLWDAAAVAAKSVWGAASTLSAPSTKAKVNAEERGGDVPEPKSNVDAKKVAPAATAKKGKAVTITEEPDVDADPIVSPTKAKATKSAWGGTGSVKSRVAPAATAAVVEEGEPELFVPLPSPSVTPVWGSTTTTKSAWGSAGAKSKVAPAATAAVVEEAEPELFVSPPPPSATPVWGSTTATKSAWGSANAKSKVTNTAAAVEENEPETMPLSAPAASGWGKKTAQAAATNKKPLVKPQLKVTISEELEDEGEGEEAPNPAPAPAPAPAAKTNKGKSARGAAAAVPSAQGGKKVQQQQQQQQAETRRGAAPSSSAKSTHANPVSERVLDNAWPGTTGGGGDGAMPGTLTFAPADKEKENGREEEEEEEGDASWFNPENMSYWANFMASQPDAETGAGTGAGTLVAPPLAAQSSSSSSSGKHALWTPVVDEESEDEDGFGDGDMDLATNMWMQYAISGGGIPTLGGAESPLAPEATTPGPEETKGKKKVNANGNESGNRAQQTSVFDRAALAGQWPKMESWLSPPARGQNSGSTRVF